MNTVLGISVVLIVLFTIFYVLGTFVEKKVNTDIDFCGKIIIGFLLFAVAFVIVDVPLEYVGVSFSTLAYAAAAVWIVLIGYAIYDTRGSLTTNLIDFSDNKVFAAIIAVGAEIWYGMKNAIYTSHSDAAYYNMSAITAIYTDTIFTYDQFSGLTDYANARAQDSWIMFVAVLAQLTGMHVLVIVNRVMAILEIVLLNMLLYEIALLLTKKNRKIAILSIPMYAVISLYYWMNGGESLLWGRLAETKSMLANVYIPAVLYCFLLLAVQRENKKIWWIIMCAVLVGGALSYSGTYMILAYTFFLALSYWLLNGRKWKDAGYAVLAVLPATLLMVVRAFS